DDLFELARADVQDQRQRRRHALEVPNVAHRSGKLDVAHPFATDLAARDLYAAALANDALVLDLLAPATGALVVFDRPKNPLAEKSVPLRLERPVVDRLRLLDLTVRPAFDVLWT